MGHAFAGRFEKIDDYRWKIPMTYMPGMRVPGIIFSDEKMLKDIIKDNAPQQVANAAHLPGIVRASMAMPDIHWGYGLPIGGVVATDIESGGVVSPGAVGYDINCGVRLMRTNLYEKDVMPYIKELVTALFSKVPTGVGSTGKINVNYREEKNILVKGAEWAVRKGYGCEEDLEYCEEGGAIKGADPSQISDRAYQRGRSQPGTLGSGNHFLEVQVVDEIYRKETAKVFGIEKGQIAIMIHTGSRGFGHQVCSDYSASMVRLLAKFNIEIPDRQLSCAPVASEEGKNYLGAMRCAANYAWANRQVIMHLTREVFESVFKENAASLGMRLIYDVAHNIAKIEGYNINGKIKDLCVHRKGATRAFPPGHKDIPRRYRETGQPVIIPGDMGRCSYLLAGTQSAEETFYSTCHGAGRLLSRTLAKKMTRSREISQELADKGIIVRCTGRETLNEEVSDAYKNVTDVVNIVQGAGISIKIAKLRPIGVIKG
ncbi:MAG: RtcB family protein [Candidatus Omnitrophica bacterium]|nr:RtcB family protein [Candidatus Omnitrophota bacterium]MBU1894239.1 RtcB family protein [Candidatus Omnitrophota bacterium]